MQIQELKEVEFERKKVEIMTHWR